MNRFLQRMSGKYQAAGADAGVDIKGITTDLARLRQEAKHVCNQRWVKHGRRTPLINAILRLRSAISAERGSVSRSTDAGPGTLRVTDPRSTHSLLTSAATK